MPLLPDLATYIWMRQQWRIFRRFLIAALAGVLVVCASGLAFLHGSGEEGDPDWFYARAALMLLLVTATLMTLWLYFKASREIRDLGRLAAAARIEEARAAREKTSRGKKRHDGD